MPLFSSPSALQSCKRHRPKTHFAPDRACCGSCLKQRRDRQSEKRGIAKRQKHALAMGDAVNAHARAAGLVPETHGAAQNLPHILGQTYPDAAALEGASEASGGGTAPGELRALLEQRQQSLKVAHRLCVAHQSAMAMRASAKSRALAVPARARPTEPSRGEKRAPSPARRESGVRLAATDGKGTRGAGKDPLKGDAPLRVTAAALGWRESPAPAGETRPSRPGSPISPRAAAAAPASAVVATDGAAASSQRSALDQMWAHLDTLWATRAAAAAAAGAAEHAEFADPVGDVQVGGGGSGARRRAGRLADEPGLRGSRRVEGARVCRVALRRESESGGGGGSEPRTGGVGGHDFGRAHG